MARIKQFVREEKDLILLLFASLVLRFIFLSPWLEDWDSVQFALGLHDFSMIDHQPHPPGYPLYILLGRIFNSFLQNDTLALTSLSALLGAAIAIPFFFLARKFISKNAALLSTALLLATPVHWTLSEVALTNIPGMFFTVTAALLLYKGKNSRKYLLAGSLLSGLTLGVRFAEYSILLALLGLVLLWRKNFQDVIKAGVYFSAGVLIWLVPLVVDAGLPQFVTAYTRQASYIASHDSLLAYSTFGQRLSRIWQLFLMGYSVYFIPLIAFILWYLFRHHKAIKRFNHLFPLVWFFAYLLPLLFIYNLEVPRHLLPLLPPLALLSGLALEKTGRQKIFALGYALVLVVLFITALNQVQKQHSLTPPSIAPVSYVKENFSPEETVLITTFTYRQFQYYAPEFKNFYFGQQKVVIPPNTKSVIVDFEKIRELEDLKNYTLREKKEFRGPETIFPRLPKIDLFILSSRN